MKKIILSAFALLTLLATPQARAWSYSDGDLLLIFRATGHNNIEYDLGSVSNLLGHPNGYTTNITGWDSSLITTEFGTGLSGVKVILAATTSSANATPTAWISSIDPNISAYNIGGSAWTANLHGTINSIGVRPENPFDVPAAVANPTNAYIIGPFDPQLGGASYDYIVSGGNFNSIATWAGKAPFSTVPVEQTIPGSFDFWAVQTTSIYPNSPPDKLIGTFTITTNGVLTFVAGPRTPSISGVTRSGNVSSIQFTTTVGNTYSVAYTNQLGAATATWPVDTTTLIGDGKTDTLNHTNSGNAAEFYRVSAQ
jgi:hypothetical protein